MIRNTTLHEHESTYLQLVLKNYLTFPDEKIIFAKRQSLLTLVPGLAMLGLLTIVVIGVSYPLFLFFLSIPYLFFVTSAVTLLTAFFLLIKHIIEWYYHIYIVTDKKLLEIRYVPLSSYTVNDVLLEQVQCTEIDLRMKGFIYEYLDIGNIAITFDRPTHHEEFVLSRISYAREIAAMLTNQLSRYAGKNASNIVWYRKSTNDNYGQHRQYSMDVMPS